MTPRTDAIWGGLLYAHPHLGKCVEETQLIETELNETKAALEREQMRLAACDVIAMADTPDSAAKVRADLPQDFQSAASGVICRVDECIALRQMVHELRDALSIGVESLHSAASFILAKHGARNPAREEAINLAKESITKANQLLP